MRPPNLRPGDVRALAYQRAGSFLNVMRTTKSTVVFHAPFTLNGSVGELPAGTYDIEVDEEAILGTERTAYRRVATLLFVQGGGTTRTLAIDPKQLEAALQKDAGP
jgi:hypothetical protein